MTEAEHTIERLKREIFDLEHHAEVLEYPRRPPHEVQALRIQLASLEQGHCALDSPTWRLNIRSGEPGLERHRAGWPRLKELVGVADLDAFVEQAVLTERESSEDLAVVACAVPEGLDVALCYDNGVLTQATLRGDGRTGQRVLDMMRGLSSVPLRLRMPGSTTESRMTKASHQGLGPSTMSPVPPYPPLLVVQGRVSARRSDLAAVDRMRIDGGESPYVRAEGAVSAALTSQRPQLGRLRGLRFMARDAVGSDGLTSRWQMLGALKSWGFAVLPLLWRCRGRQEVLDFVASLERAATEFDYPLEGGILSLNRRLPGATDRAEAGLSFPRSGRSVQVRRVYAAVSRTGVALPVVELSSEQGLERAPLPAVKGGWLRVQPGQRGLLRPGRVAPELQTSDVSPPLSEAELAEGLQLRCSACAGGAGTKALCEVPKCPARDRSMLFHVLGPRGMGLSRFEPAWVDALSLAVDEGPSGSWLARFLSVDPNLGIARGLPQDVAARFSLAQNSWRRGLPLFRLLYLSGIPGLGERTGRMIAQQVFSADRLMQLGAKEVARLQAVEPFVIERFTVWLGEPGQASVGRSLIQELRQIGVRIIDSRESFPAPFAGQEVAVSGEFNGGVGPVVDRIERLGGSVQTRINRTTDLVVLGMNSDKARNAAAMYSIPVITNFLAFDAALP